jgi:hypothetical protein
VGDKKGHGRRIAGMNQGDLPSFQGVMGKGHDALKKSAANLKHMIVFSDGDPAAPTQQLMQDIRNVRITVSTVLISGHAGPDTMMWIADEGRGRFYNIQNPAQLPQIFIKEAAVILKSAIFEEPFTPRLVSASELVRGIGSFPVLRGYVATTPKARAEMPLISDKGDPVLAHWQYGLGRAVAFTSDAKAKWAKDWLNWEQYRQFWSQTAQWSLRRVANADFTTEVSIDKGEGHISVEALDENGDYRNFINLQTVVVSPKGERATVRLEQVGPGRYEATFSTRETGSYLLNLMEIKDGVVAGSMSVGASVNYSPEFTAPEPNLSLLTRLAEASGGKVLDLVGPTLNPFLHDRKRTFQPRDWWEWLLKAAVILFVLDVGIRRLQLDREQWEKGLAMVKQTIFFWKGSARPAKPDESLAALLARRDEVRARQSAPTAEPRPELFTPQQPPTEGSTPAPSPQVKLEEAEPAASDEEKPVSTTSRLLDAKRKAQRKSDR